MLWWSASAGAGPGQAPRNYAHNTALVAAPTPRGLQAQMTLDGAMTSDALAANDWCTCGRELTLLPTLTPGQVVICDNLSVHQRVEIRTLIETAGCEVVFQPAYSPDFSPIEPAFGKLKMALRQAQARTQDALEAAIAAAMAASRPPIPSTASSIAVMRSPDNPW